MGLPQTTHLTLAEEGRILIVSIANPPHNFLTSKFFLDLAETVSLMAQTRYRAVLITGQGRNFSKGADLEEIRESGGALNKKTLAFGNELLDRIEALPKPIVAAIQGACFGGGLELALACHLRVCADNARLGLPELTAGLVPGLGGIHRLIRAVGEAKALEMMLMGDLVSSEEALGMCLVHRVFPKKELFENTIRWIKTLLGAPQEAISTLLSLVHSFRPVNEKHWRERSERAFLELARQRFLEAT